MVNNKKYIGKTLNTVEHRWREHLKEHKRFRNEKRALYDAMKKYGIENFKCETLLECPDDILEYKEKEYIELFQTYHLGYNLTLGGDGKQLYNYDAIVSYYTNNIVTMKETAKHFNCSVDTIKDILVKKHIPIRIIKNDGTWVIVINLKK